MGTWGVGIFEDDTALEIQSEYRDLLGDRVDEPEATTRMIQQRIGPEPIPEQDSIFWLALAATQWKLGRLQARVLVHTLNVIDSGTDLEQWNEPELRAKRELVLRDLREQLTSTPPRPKRVPRRFRDICDWKVGDVIAYRLASGKWAAMRVTRHHEDDGGRSPVVLFYDWVGEEPLSVERIDRFATRKPTPSVFAAELMIGRRGARQLPTDRLRVLGNVSRPTPPWSGYMVTGWKRLDEYLASHFGLE